ncbi:MAG: glycerophosphoryl diester phosphodiesterase membrane domain-containing protein [Anaerolineae bacterium]|nr:glycerophosphoryl diester phosphodiesterase membrane domain-containing protein [Anaerolineae bacterium]
MQLIPIIVILERKSGTEAIRRGWDLCRRRFWNVIWFYALLIIFAQLITTAPTLLINIAVPWLALNSSTELIGILISTGVTLVSGLLYTPLQLTAMTLLYFDLRVRTEGFDLTWTTEHALDEEISPENVIAQAPPAEGGSLITQSELGNFVLLSLGILGIFVVIYFVIMAISILFVGLNL